MLGGFLPPGEDEDRPNRDRSKPGHWRNQASFLGRDFDWTDLYLVTAFRVPDPAHSSDNGACYDEK